MKTYFRVQWRPFEDLLKVPRKTSFTFCAVVSPNFNIGTLRFSDWTDWYQTVVCPGLVFLNKLQNYDLMMTNFVALRRPNNDHLKLSRMTTFTSCVVLSYKFRILHVQCPWMTHCTNLKRFPQYFEMSQYKSLHYFWCNLGWGWGWHYLNKLVQWRLF